MDRETLTWALVFSVPVGVGITGYAAHIVRRGVLDPVAVLAGIGTTVLLFSIFFFAFSRGTADAGRQRDEEE